ncbi:hypothetical protein F4678DRAFT_425078 [Xylaria arbuscula]|nr:hypothetical protein F4678DRAFT_425078 [Xylaria arbuscula]
MNRNMSNSNSGLNRLSQVILCLSQICETFREGLTPEEKELFQDIGHYENLLRDLKAHWQSEEGSEKYGNIYNVSVMSRHLASGCAPSSKRWT